MTNLEKPDPKALGALLKIASAKLGTTPEVLEAQLRDGTFDKALANMKGGDAAKLRAALSDPNTAKKILSTPQARALYRKLSGK